MDVRIPSELVAGVALVLAATLSACTGVREDDRSSGPRFEEITCPDDVEILVVPTHTCGLVAPESDAPQRIFVVVVEPPVPSDASPVLETGVDLGMTPSYGGLAPIAQRTGRRVIIVDLPGTGHSTPSLECPEVEALGDEAAHRGASDMADAVTACRTRLVAAGADIDALTPSRLGEALAAVMTALDVPRWVVMGHGTTAEAGRQLALTHPDRVEALVVDSMVADPSTDVRQVIADIARACRADRACLRRNGDPAVRWQQARRALRREPLLVEVGETTVTIDERTLERGVRWLTAPVAGPAQLPAFLREAATRTPGHHLQLLAATLSVAPPLCVGYVPKCETDQRLVLGATLSAQCPTAADLEVWSAACRAWGIAMEQHDAVPLTGVPTLALYGGYDPFAPLGTVTERLGALLPEAFRVELAAGGHNVLGVECVRNIRNAWLSRDVSLKPPRAACLSAPPIFE